MAIFEAMFETTFERIIGNEGKFQDDSKDRGNWTSGIIGQGQLKGTKYGIAAMTYPSLDIKNLTLDDAKKIYYNQWWIPLKMNQFPKALQYQMIDASINHGMHETSKMLQRAIGANPDGILGPVSISTLNRLDVNDVLMLFLSYRLEFMTNIRTWDTYAKGWTRRVAHNLRYAAQDN